MTDYFLDIESLMADLGATDYNGKPLDALICNGLSEDSRKLQSGDLFIARPGIESDGRRYINQAVSKGAIAVLAEAHELEQFVQAKSASVRVYQLAGLGEKLGEIADKLYQHPCQSASLAPMVKLPAVS